MHAIRVSYCPCTEPSAQHIPVQRQQRVLWRPQKKAVRQPADGCHPTEPGWGHFHHVYQPSNQLLIPSLSLPLLFRQTPAVTMFSSSSVNKPLLSRMQGQRCLLLCWETEDSERAILCIETAGKGLAEFIRQNSKSLCSS